VNSKTRRVLRMTSRAFRARKSSSPTLSKGGNTFVYEKTVPALALLVGTAADGFFAGSHLTEGLTQDRPPLIVTS
jgi:hypothetical protein